MMNELFRIDRWDREVIKRFTVCDAKSFDMIIVKILSIVSKMIFVYLQLYITIDLFFLIKLLLYSIHSILYWETSEG